MQEEVLIGKHWYSLQAIDRKVIIVSVNQRAMYVSKAMVREWRKVPRQEFF